MSAPNTVLIPHRKEEIEICRVYLNYQDWQDVIRREAFRCFYCGAGIFEFLLKREQKRDTGVAGGIATPDHLWPRFTGGCECCANIVAACSLCNSIKKNRTVAEFIADRPQFEEKAGEFSTSVLYLGESDFKHGKVFLPRSIRERHASFTRIFEALAEKMALDGPTRPVIINGETRHLTDYSARRSVLKQQASRMALAALERAGQIRLPFAGDERRPSASVLARPLDRIAKDEQEIRSAIYGEEEVAS